MVFYAALRLHLISHSPVPKSRSVTASPQGEAFALHCNSSINSNFLPIHGKTSGSTKSEVFIISLFACVGSGIVQAGILFDLDLQPLLVVPGFGTLEPDTVELLLCQFIQPIRIQSICGIN